MKTIIETRVLFCVLRFSCRHVSLGGVGLSPAAPVSSFRVSVRDSGTAAVAGPLQVRSFTCFMKRPDGEKHFSRTDF